MAGRSERYTIKFEADVSGARQSLSEVNRALDSIISKSKGSGGLNLSFKEAAASAQQLKNSLNDAMNVNTGRLDFSKFTQNLSTANTDLNTVIRNLTRMGDTGRTAINKLGTSLSSAEIPVKKLSGAVGSLMDTLGRTVKWTLASNFIHSIQSTYTAAMSYAEKLNKTLTSIQQVSNLTLADMQKFTTQANNMAKTLSTTTKSYADASLIYFQQGDSAELAAKKAEITLKATNSAFTATAQEMSQMLTATWNAYQVGADQLEHYVDVMAALGANTATSLEEISGALQKVASTANVTGVSMEKMSSMIATVSSTTRQSAQVVGTAFNTVLGRISSLKLGETLEDGVNLTKYTQALQQIGVSVLDARGELRDMGTVIEEIGNKWSTMTVAQQSALASTIGGVRQYTNLMALFNNWDKYQANLKIANNSNGQLQRMQDIYANSWEGASKRSRAAVEELYEELIDDQAIIKIKNAIASVTEAITKLVKGLGGLPGIIFMVGQSLNNAFGDKIAAKIGRIGEKAYAFGDFFKQGGEKVTGKSFFSSVGQILSGKYVGLQQRQQGYALQQLGLQSGRAAAHTDDATLRALYTQQGNLYGAQAGILLNRKPDGSLAKRMTTLQRSTAMRANSRELQALETSINARAGYIDNRNSTFDKLSDADKIDFGGWGLAKTSMKLDTAADRQKAFNEAMKQYGGTTGLKGSALAQQQEMYRIAMMPRSTPGGAAAKDAAIEQFFQNQMLQNKAMDTARGFREQLYGADNAALMGDVTPAEIAVLSGWKMGNIGSTSNAIDDLVKNAGTLNARELQARAQEITTLGLKGGIVDKGSGLSHDLISALQTYQSSGKTDADTQALLSFLQTNQKDLTEGPNSELQQQKQEAKNMSHVLQGNKREYYMNEGKKLSTSEGQADLAEIERGLPKLQTFQEKLQSVNQKFGTIGQNAMSAGLAAGRGITAVNAAFDAFKTDSLEQKFSAATSIITGFAQSMSGGIWAMAAYAVAVGVTMIVKAIDNARLEKLKKDKEIAERLENESNQIIENSKKTLELDTQYTTLKNQLEEGIITQTDYQKSLLETAKALGIQSASVLALKGDYEGLEKEIESTLIMQERKNAEDAKRALTQYRGSTESLWNAADDKSELDLWHDTPNGYGVRNIIGGMRQSQYAYGVAGDYLSTETQRMAYEAIGMSGAHAYAGQAGYNQFLANVLGGRIDSKGDYMLGYWDDLVIGQNPEDIQKMYFRLLELQDMAEGMDSKTQAGRFWQSTMRDSDTQALIGVLGSIVEPMIKLQEAEWSTSGQVAIRQKNIDASTFTAQTRHDLEEEFLASWGITEDTPKYLRDRAKETARTIIDDYVTSLGTEGATAAALAKTKTTNFEAAKDKAKKMGISERFLPDVNSDIWEYTDSAALFGYYITPERQASVEKGLAAQRTIQTGRGAVKSSWNLNDTNFNVQDTLLSLYDTALAAGFDFNGVSKSDISNMSKEMQIALYGKIAKFFEDSLNDPEFINTFKEGSGDLAIMVQKALKFAFEQGTTMDSLTSGAAQVHAFTGKEYDFSDPSKYAESIKLLHSDMSQMSEEELATLPDDFITLVTRLYETVLDLESIEIPDLFDPMTKSTTQLITNVQTLMGMELDPTKWGKDELDLMLKTLNTFGYTLTNWLDMSTLERQRAQLGMIQEQLVELKNSADAGKHETEIKLLEEQAVELAKTINSVELSRITAQTETLKEKWDEVRDAAKTALDIISQHMGSNTHMNFEDIEKLRQNLLDAGIEGDRVATILSRLQQIGDSGKKVNHEQVWAQIMAATESALMRVSTLDAERSQYEGLTTEMEISEIDASKALKEITPLRVESDLDAQNKVDNVPESENVTAVLDAGQDAQVQGTVAAISVTAVPDVEGQTPTGTPNALPTIKVTKIDGTGVDITFENGQVPTVEAALEIAKEKGLQGEELTAFEKELRTRFPDGKIPNGITAEVKFGMSTDPTSVQALTEATAGKEAGVQLYYIDPTNGELVTAATKGSQKVITVKWVDTSGQEISPADLQGEEPSKPTALDQFNAIIDNSVFPHEYDRTNRYSRASISDTWKAWIWAHERYTNGQDPDYGYTPKVSDLGDDYAKAIKRITSEWVAEDPDFEVTEDLILTQTNVFLKDIEDLLKSEDPEFQQLGLYLIAGLAQGLKDAGIDFDWKSVIAGMGLAPDIEQALKDELEIESPSHLTERLAPYLIQGLQVGIDKAIADYKPSAKGLAGKLESAFLQELQQVSAAEGGLEGVWNRIYAEEEAKAKEETGGAQGYKELARERTQTRYKEWMAGEENKFWTTQAWNDPSNTAMTPWEKYIMGQVVDQIEEESGMDWETIIKEDKLDWAMERAQEIINKKFRDIDGDLEETWATIRKTWSDGLVQLFNDDDIQKKYYDSWTKTFSAIAAARKQLWNHESIMDGLMDDAESLAEIYRILAEAGMTFDEITAFVQDPNANMDRIQFRNYDPKMALRGDDRFFNTDEQNRIIGTTWEQYSANREEQFRAMLTGDSDLAGGYITEMMNNNEAARAAIETRMGEQYGEFFQEGEGGVIEIKADANIEKLINILLGGPNSEGWITETAKTLGYQNEEDMTTGMYTARAGQDAGMYKSQTAELNEYREMLGITKEELTEFTEHQVENGVVVGKTRLEQERAAASLYRMQRGMTTATNSAKKFYKELNKCKKQGVDTTNAFNNLRDMYADLFDLTDSEADKLSEGFLESEENAKLLEKAIKKDDKAWDQLKNNAAEDILMSVKIDDENFHGEAKNLLQQIAEYDFEKNGIKVGASIESAPFFESLNSMVLRSQESADAMKAALSSVGVEGEWVPTTIWVPDQENAEEWIGDAPRVEGYDEWGLPIVGYQDVSAEVKEKHPGHEETVWLFQGKNATYKGGGSPPSTNSSKPSTGGGGKKKKVQSYKKGSDEKERYHQIGKKLEKQSNELEKLSKLKERTFGAKHLEALNKEIAALEKENQLYADQADQASVNLEANKKILTSYGAKFDEDGTINYEEYMDKILADYNAAVDKYNNSAQKAGDELALKKAEEIYNEAKKAMEDYEEDMEKLNEAQQAMLENQNKISAAMLEGIQYKVEVQWDFNDRDVKYLQYLRNKWEDVLDRADDSMTKMIEEAAKYEDNLKSLAQEQSELDAAFKAGTLNEADYATGLQDINDRSLEMLENLLSIKKEIKEAYGNALNKASEELEKHTSILDHSRSVMGQYIQMQQLMGLGADYSGLKKMYQFQYDSSIASLNASKQYLDQLKQSRAQIEANIAEHGWTDVLKQQWEDVNAAIIQGEDDLLEKTNQALNDAQDKFTNTMQAIIQGFDNTLFGMKNGLAKLEDDYAYYQEEQGRYLSTSKELYEVSKLNRQINDSINDATTQTSKARLKALQEQVKLQAENNRLTEYDVNMLQLQYKHALALQELEDAKNAKSVVRLTRDENGNYGYQYTADDKAISDAQQKVEDALQEINELAANRVSEIEQAAIQAEREYRDALLEIAQDTTLTTEERMQKMDLLTKRHAETMQFNQEQYNNAQSALLTNQQYVYERYGTSIRDNTGLVQDQYNESVAAMISKTQDYAAFLKKQLSDGGEIHDAMEQYKSDLQLVDATSGLGGWAGMTASVEDFEEANKAANKAIEDVMKTMKETMKNISSITDSWEDHADVLERVIADYEELATDSVDALRKLGGNIAGTEVGATTGAATAEHVAGTDQKQWMYIWGTSGFSGTWSGYDTEAAAMRGARSDIVQKIYSTLEAGETDAETAANKAKLEAIVEKAYGTIKVSQYRNGGLIDYTGPAWVDGSISQPELMLNASDTQNILRTVETLRQIDIETLTELYSAINQNAMGMIYAMHGVGAQNVLGSHDELQQNVTITAEFPNATDRSEIEGAFEDIINLAAQYANRR